MVKLKREEEPKNIPGTLDESAKNKDEKVVQEKLDKTLKKAACFLIDLVFLCFVYTSATVAEILIFWLFYQSLDMALIQSIPIAKQSFQIFKLCVSFFNLIAYTFHIFMSFKSTIKIERDIDKSDM